MHRVVRQSICSSLLVFASTIACTVIAADGGEIFANECAACHTIAGDAPSGVGPNLSDIVGRKAGVSTDVFTFSKALQEFAAGGGVWDAATLDKFLVSPKDLIPGSIMSYGGLGSAEDRTALIAWLDDPARNQQSLEASVNYGSFQGQIDKILALDADPDYGEYLASECLTCHSDKGTTAAVPPIKGLPAAYFLNALLEYKSGARDNQVMKLMAGNLGDDELGALAVYFSAK